MYIYAIGRKSRHFCGAMSAMMANRAENCTFSKRFPSRERENVPLALVREIKSLPFLPFQLCNARFLDFRARSSHGYTTVRDELLTAVRSFSSEGVPAIRLESLAFLYPEFSRSCGYSNDNAASKVSRLGKKSGEKNWRFDSIFVQGGGKSVNDRGISRYYENERGIYGSIYLRITRVNSHGIRVCERSK